MTLRVAVGVALFAASGVLGAQKNHLSPPIGAGMMSVPTSPASDAKPQSFRDGKFGVRFQVPAGWHLAQHDGEVSTFHLDAHSAPEKAEMRGAASLGFNPFPMSTLAGATFYYSVTRHLSNAECAAQVSFADDVQDIGGMEFRHGYEEFGRICTEARDEVYTAYRKGTCYRFDLATNTFCSISSGAEELTERQLRAVEEQMTGILGTVALDWKKGGTHPVPVPAQRKPSPRVEPEVLPRPGQARASRFRRRGQRVRLAVEDRVRA